MPELRLFQAVHHLLHAASLDEKRCSLCHVPFSPSSQKNSVPFTSPDLSLCPSCASLLEPRTSGYCPSCGLPQAMRDAPPSLCGECLCSPPPWEHFRFYGVYANTLKELLLRGKFGADSTLLHLLGKLLAQRCLDLPRPDAIVPMPLHPSRLRERGIGSSSGRAASGSPAFGSSCALSAYAASGWTEPAGTSEQSKKCLCCFAFRAWPETLAH